MQIGTEQDHKTESLHPPFFIFPFFFPGSMTAFNTPLAFTKIRLHWFFCGGPQPFPLLEYVQKTAEQKLRWLAWSHLSSDKR
jgi:hypothetical protein